MEKVGTGPTGSGPSQGPLSSSPPQSEVNGPLRPQGKGRNEGPAKRRSGMRDEHSRPRVAIETQGCKLNQADSEALARRFAAAGYDVVPPGSAADVYVLNTCTVTHVADSKARQALNRAGKASRRTLVVATGCYAQRRPQDLRALPSVDVVAGNEEKDRLVQMVEAVRGGRDASAPPGPPPPQGSGLLSSSPGERQREGVSGAATPQRLSLYTDSAATARWTGRTRATVKIQEGCDQVCAYCIVPKVRGRERSLPPDQIAREVAARVAEGYQEVVLTGTQLGSYGFEWEGASLAGLVARLLAETPIARLRVSSVQAQELTAGLLALWGDPRLCPHFHIPLQSGSEGVLRRMRRRYSPAQFEAAVGRVRASVPHASITTDVIAGFPGETEEEAEESFRFCERMPFTAMNVFPFSPRPGTTAAHLVPQVDAWTRKRRTERLLALARQKADAARDAAGAQLRPVLWEQQDTWRGQPVLSGLTDTYLRVFTHPDPALSNRITDTRLSSRDGALWGEPLL